MWPLTSYLQDDNLRKRCSESLPTIRFFFFIDIICGHCYAIRAKQSDKSSCLWHGWLLLDQPLYSSRWVYDVKCFYSHVCTKMQEVKLYSHWWEGNSQLRVFVCSLKIIYILVACKKTKMKMTIWNNGLQYLKNNGHRKWQPYENMWTAAMKRAHSHSLNFVWRLHLPQGQW